MSWLKRQRPSPRAEVVLMCLPYAGGGGSSYRDWSDDLPDTVEVVTAELPGRETRLAEEACGELAPVIDALRAETPRVIADRPYALFGHSLGALIAFELARALRRDGLPPPLALFASGREAPTEREPGRLLHELADDAFIDEMVTRYNGIPRILLEEPDLLALYLPAMKADIRLTETYTYVKDAPFTFPLHVMNGREDRRLTRDLLTPWADQTAGATSFHSFDGGHFFIRDSRREVLECVTRLLKLHTVDRQAGARVTLGATAEPSIIALKAGE